MAAKPVKKTAKKPAKKSLFSRLTGAFQEEHVDFSGKKIDPGQTAADIDRGIENEIEAIKKAKVKTISGDKLFDGGWGEAGDMVNIMDLTPVYAMIGGRTGRQADNLRETCGRVFSQHTESGKGKALIKGDQFVMRFLGASESQGFHLAAIIVNDIGTRILGNRFESMDVPGLLVVADAADVINADGTLNTEKAAAVVDSGGRAVEINKPGPDAPQWLQLRWNKRDTWGQAAMVRTAAGRKDKSGSEPIWVPQASGSDSREFTRQGQDRGLKRDADEFAQRSGKDRRHAKRPFPGRDQRHSFDRRGRGF